MQSSGFRQITTEVVDATFVAWILVINDYIKGDRLRGKESDFLSRGNNSSGE